MRIPLVGFVRAREADLSEANTSQLQLNILLDRVLPTVTNLLCSDFNPPF